MTRRELIHTPSATALPRRCQHIAADGSPGRQNTANTQQCSAQGEQTPHRTRNNPTSQTGGDAHKDAFQTSQKTKSP